MTTNPNTPPKAKTQAELAAEQSSMKRRNALVKSSAALRPYGTPAELAEMVTRFQMTVPGASKLDPNEVLALAQAAFVHGLNPIIGECWWIKGSGFAPGIRGLRRKGREQLAERDAVLSMDFILVTDPVERVALQIPDGAMAYKCVGKNTEKTKAYVESAGALSKAYFGPNGEAITADSWRVLQEALGAMPVAIGIGYVTAEQMAELDNPRWLHYCKVNKAANTEEYIKKDKSKGAPLRPLFGPAPCPDCHEASRARPSAMPHSQRAMKRAEAHMWKQECDLPFDIRPDSDVENVETVASGQVIEGSFRDIPDSIETGEEAEAWLKLQQENAEAEAKRSAMTPAEQKAAATQASETMFGDPTGKPSPAPVAPADAEREPRPVSDGREKRVWPQDTLLHVKKKFFDDATHINRIVGTLNLSPFDPSDPIKWIDGWVGQYKALRTDHPDVEPPEASRLASQAWYLATAPHETVVADNFKWMAEV